MGRYTDEMRRRYASGEDPNKLKAELVRYEMTTKSPFVKPNGYCDLKALDERTLKAETENKTTPLAELKDIELASILLRYSDPDHPFAREAFDLARNKGLTVLKQPLTSTQLQRQLNNYRNEQAAKPKPEKSCFHRNLGEFKR